MSNMSELEKLTDALRRLVNLLALDVSCRWTSKFRHDLEQATQLMLKPFSVDDLAKLSASIRHVYGGMGSFNDYEPARYDPVTGHYTAIPGTESFDVLRRDVFDLAIALIAVKSV